MRSPYLAAALLLAPAGIMAQSTPDQGVTAKAIKAHVAFLADDLLEGRDTGSRGHQVAARYVATQFEAMGLTPAVKGDWYQNVAFARVQPKDDSELTINGRAFAHKKDAVISGNGRVEADILFGGFCLDKPELGLNDLRGLKVKGKIIACLTGFPKGMPSDIGAHLNADKVRVLSARGAIGYLSIRTLEREKQRPWARVIATADDASVNWLNADGTPYDAAPNIKVMATLDRAAAARLFDGTSRSLDALLAEADKKGGKPKGFALGKRAMISRSVGITPFTSPNVIGLLPGSDPAVAHEYVLVMGHLDHIGIRTSPTGPDAANADKINNGAMDNAAGIATLLEAARAMAKAPTRPRRPVLFAAVTGEEKGLLGADYLSRFPVVDGQIVGVVNLDMPILTYDFTDVIAFGAEHSTLGPLVATATARDAVKLSPDPVPEEGLFTRSDHYRFVQRGIPSVFLVTGYAGDGAKASEAFLADHYHTPSDDLNLPFNWEAGAKFARINSLIATEIANAPEAPRWYADSFFGKTFAPAAPKAKRP
jgi:hypothetical protein